MPLARQHSPESPLRIAVVDLGSNSFHLLIARKELNGWIVEKHVKEVVRLRSGLSKSNHLSWEAMSRGFSAIESFGALLSHFNLKVVRAVGTATLRQAKNRDVFITHAEERLGYPIEVISGMEEAELIYYALATDAKLFQGEGKHCKCLAMDIGGGSIELAFGIGITPLNAVSIDLGCVELQQQFFEDGAIHKKGFDALIQTCKIKMASTVEMYKKLGWQFCVAGSGSAKALLEVAFANQLTLKREITKPILIKIQSMLLAKKNLSQLDIAGLQDNNKAIFPATVGIFLALMEGLSIQSLHISDASLRNGLILSLLEEAEMQES